MFFSHPRPKRVPAKQAPPPTKSQQQQQQLIQSAPNNLTQLPPSHIKLLPPAPATLLPALPPRPVPLRVKNLPVRSKGLKTPLRGEKRLARTAEVRSRSEPNRALENPPNDSDDGSSGAVLEQRVDDATRHGQGPTIDDLIVSKLDAVITLIDGEAFSGDERELVIFENPQTHLRGGWGVSSLEVSRNANNAISSVVTAPKSTNYFAKAGLYANSKLPANLPSLKLYLPSYPLICLAAQYSQRVYTKPTGKEREALVEADWRMGTKAMMVKSVPIDHMNTVCFAIRGSQTFMDWAVNLNSTPAAPTDFLDDPGNLCHSGFLAVARKMMKPMATRIRSLLEEDPSRRSCTLLMTGHSAGGAVASLLYAHMLAEDVKSELNMLTCCFKRIHCITFGSPPISLLPLNKPAKPQFKKSLFLSFINEGDPVPRADKAYIRSLLSLYLSPAPGSTCLGTLVPSVPQPKFSLPGVRPKPKKTTSSPAALATPVPVWPVPPATLSNGGRLVILRASQETGEEDVRAQITCDQQLRGVVFGDPVMHMMKLYARRVEILATKAVTAKAWE
ncbi:hypothetical protein MMC20_000014 [Loxospora ochrophaea]|nr:hypothetical protein [Loxospora ochrophaea]